MKLLIAQKREQIFLGQPNAHELKYTETHKTRTNIVPFIAFFEQHHQADHVSGVQDKLKKGKKKVYQESDCK